ncbi:MAG: PAS domain S-box protein, partial [Deltaproteobacteria bacterium]|nr:PAS domain S-box protein [Deltaproteobacteria bacterium]
MKIPYTNRKNRTIRLRQRLSFKLTAWVAGALILLTSLAVFTAYHLLEREAIRSMLQTGYWFSDTVKRATRFSMLKDQRDSVHATIEAIGSQEGVEVIRVFNKQGRIMFSSRKAETGHLVDLQAEACYACHFRDRPLSKLPQAQRSRIFSAAAHGGSAHRVLGVITPIYSEPACYTDPCHAHPPGQTVLGVLDVGLSLENADHQVAASTRRVVLFAVVLCLVIATVLLGITYLFLNRPLSRLLHATRQITQGDYDHPVQASSHDEIGELAGAFEVMRQSVRDKTEALEESRRRFQTLFEQVPCYISVQDRDFRLVAANRMFDRDFGAKIGEYCFSLYKGRDQKCEGCAVEQCFQDGGVHWAEERVKDQDGTVRHFLNLAAPITDARGQVVHVMEMATDVTPLRRLEEELRVSEEKYRLFFNNDPNAIFVFAQEDWRILDANQRAVSDYGYSYEALLALTFLELADPADQARLREFLSERVNVLPRLHMLCADGRVFLVNLRASYGEHMGRPAVIAATADISETLKAEEQLVQAAKMATLGEMSAGVAHE